MNTKSPPKKEQAVILIHGIGEQTPMKTLRAFIKTVWSEDEDLRWQNVPADLYSGPDRFSSSFELRRLVTVRDRKNIRTDFFEFYWAHKTTGTKFWHVSKWFWQLLTRPPKHSTASVRFAWQAARIITVISTILSLLLFWRTPDFLKDQWRYLAPFVPLIIAYFTNSILLRVVGDAARYLVPAPYNIQNRHEIRQAGVALLDRIIKSQRYERIIIVGHSLGSMIGYDILRGLWPQYNIKHNTDAETVNQKLKTLETLAAESPFDRDAYRSAQREYADALRQYGNGWCITDFLTLGSPLAHSAWLLAESISDFEEKLNQREFPTCPPYNQGNAEPDRFSYDISGDDGKPLTLPDHAAVFAPVRWTNLYFKSNYAVYGDIIAGSVNPLFGPGIVDIPLHPPKRNAGFFSHNYYWVSDPKNTNSRNEHIDALRSALNLRDGT